MIKIRANFDYPPIPVRDCDWSAYIDGEYEPGQPLGRTKADAVADLHEQIREKRRERMSPLFTTSPKALAYQPRMCTCRDPWNCSGREGRAADGSHCREHLTPQLEEDS